MDPISCIERGVSQTKLVLDVSQVHVYLYSMSLVVVVVARRHANNTWRKGRGVWVFLGLNKTCLKDRDGDFRMGQWRGRGVAKVGRGQPGGRDRAQVMGGDGGGWGG